MIITRREKVRIRHHLGVAAAGSSNVNLNQWLVNKRVLSMEAYINSLSVEELSMLTGRPFGAVAVIGNPTAGQHLTLRINGTDFTYQVTNGDAASPQGLFRVVNALANLVNAGAVMVYAATNLAANQQEPPQQVPAACEVSLLSWKFDPFELEMSFEPGGCALAITADGGTYVGNEMSYKPAVGAKTVTHGFIPILDQLENEILFSRSHLAASSAGEGKAIALRADELAQRHGLYRYYCGLMGNMLAVGGDPTGQLGGGQERVIGG